MTDDSLLPFDLPSVQRKKVSAAFDGGLISSDGGLVLLREAERSLGLAETLAGCIRDRRKQAQVVHSLSAMLRSGSPDSKWRLPCRPFAPDTGRGCGTGGSGPDSPETARQAQACQAGARRRRGVTEPVRQRAPDGGLSLPSLANRRSSLPKKVHRPNTREAV